MGGWGFIAHAKEMLNNSVLKRSLEGRVSVIFLCKEHKRVWLQPREEFVGSCAAMEKKVVRDNGRICIDFGKAKVEQ